jgi:tetratricopeptide (TPR) repeat protein
MGSQLWGDFSLWPFLSAFIGNSYFFVITTTILTLVLTGVCLIVKYTPNMMNDLQNGTNSELPELGLKLWVAVILLFPVFFDAGPLWFVLWWLIIFWSYLNIFEKRITYVFIALIFMSSWLAHVGAGFLTYTESNVNREIFTISQSIGTAQDKADVDAWIQQHPSDAEPLNTKALWAIDKGDYATAVALLRRGLDLDPGNARYYNHLGVALAGLKKNDDAIKAFKNATTLKPGDLVYHYNLSRIYQSTFNFYEADNSIAKASKIDPEKVRFLLDQEGKAKAGKKYIVEQVPLVDQLQRQMRPGPELKQAADGLWNMAFGIVDRNWAIYVSLGVILVLFLLGHAPEDKFTKKCNRCGKHYYAGSVSGSGYPMCLQCLWMETKTKKEMNTVLIAKTEDIRGFRVRSAKSTSRLELMLPGLGSFNANKTAKGLARLTAFGAGLLLIVTGGRFIFSFIPSETDYSLYIRAAGVLMAAILYWRVYKNPPLKFGA